MLMDLARGSNLQDILVRSRRFNLDQTRIIAGQVVTALEYIHSQNIVYGDLKPDNIVVREEGIITLLDFGSARFVDENNNCSRLLNEAKGTLDYSPPEYIMSEPQSYDSDFWSLVDPKCNDRVV